MPDDKNEVPAPPHGGGPKPNPPAGAMGGPATTAGALSREAPAAHEGPTAASDRPSTELPGDPDAKRREDDAARR